MGVVAYNARHFRIPLRTFPCLGLRIFVSGACGCVMVHDGAATFREYLRDIPARWIYIGSLARLLTMPSPLHTRLVLCERVHLSARP